MGWYLAQHQPDLRTKTQELENLSQRYAQSQKVKRDREREREGFQYYHFILREGTYDIIYKVSLQSHYISYLL